MATITLPNGTKIEASESLLNRLLTGIEDGVHYMSSTHGRTKISTMATPHIRNAVAKILRETVENSKSLTNPQFCKMLKKGIGNDNLTFLALVKELEMRRD